MTDADDPTDRTARLERTVPRAGIPDGAPTDVRGDEDDDPDDDAGPPPIYRRTLVRSGTLLGLLGFAGVAGADPQGRVGTASDPARTVFTEALAGGVTGGSRLTDLAGDGLSVEAGALTAARGLDVASGDSVVVPDADALRFGGDFRTTDVDDGIARVDLDVRDSDTHAGVADDGATAVSDVDTIDFGDSLDVTASGRSVTVDATADGISEWVDAGDGLLEPESSYTGVDVADVETDGVSGGVTGGTDVTSLVGNGLDVTGGALGVATGGVGTDELATPFADLATLVGSPVRAGGAVETGTVRSSGGVTLETNGGDRGLRLGTPDEYGSEVRARDGVAGGNVIAGSPRNGIVSGATRNERSDDPVGAVVGGGGLVSVDGTAEPNVVEDDFATVGGGLRNTASGFGATIAGGDNNEASGDESTVAGGTSNTASGGRSNVGGSTVAGGTSNTASGAKSAVAGGGSNTASGRCSTVAGGEDNEAVGECSFAAGRYAEAADDNAFVWNDGSGAADLLGGVNDRFSSTTPVGSTPEGPNTFSVKATGGVRFVTDTLNEGYAWVDTDGNLKASGTKDFVETVATPAGDRTVTYTAVEAPTVRTEACGVVTVADGVADVDLPDHFAWVTDPDEPLVVQATPHADPDVAVDPRVVERSVDRLRIEDAGDAPATYELSYTVKGTRAGYADRPVVSDPDGGDAEGARADEGNAAEAADD